MKTKISIQARVDADRKKAWDYYTLPEHIVKWNFADPSWHCPRAEIDMTIGGRYLARMEARDGSFGFDFDAVYTDIKEAEHFTYEFGGRSSTVSFEEKEGKTLVTVSFDPEDENPIELQRTGWQMILDNYKKHVENN